MEQGISYRKARLSDSTKLSVLFPQVYIQTYGQEGVSDEFSNDICKQFSVARLEHTIAEEPDSIIVAEHKNNLVGVAEIGFQKECPLNDTVAPELNKLYILEWFCGKGIGKRLLQEAEQTVQAKGLKEMWLWVLLSNSRAVSFYENQQYTSLGRAFFKMETNIYENLIMRKSLPA